MIKRIVIMDITPGKEIIFMDLFEQVKAQIRSREGCHSLEVLQGDKHGQITLCTISEWIDEHALEAYRLSPLFIETWSKVKPLFASKAKAWTLIPLQSLS